MNSNLLKKLVNEEIESIEQPELVRAIRSHLEPDFESKAVDWDYGKPGDQYDCWFVCKHQKSNTAIVYCEEGFGPSDPWGLIFIEGPHASMGMDSQWYSRLQDAIQDSPLWDGEASPDYEVL